MTDRRGFFARLVGVFAALLIPFKVRGPREQRFTLGPLRKEVWVHYRIYHPGNGMRGVTQTWIDGERQPDQPFEVPDA